MLVLSLVVAGVPGEAWARPAAPSIGGLTLGGARSAPAQRSSDAAGVPDAVGADDQDLPTRELSRPAGAVGPEQTFPPPSMNAGPSVQSVSLAQPRPTSTGVVAGSRELAAERTRNSTVFANPDGTKTLRVYDGTAFVPGQGGALVPEDTALSRAADGRLVPKAAGPVSVAADSSDPELASVQPSHGVSIGYGVADAKAVAGAVDGASVTFPGVRTDADVSLRVADWGVKEDLVLHSKDAPTRWLFPLKLRGVTPQIDEKTGAVQFVDSAGTVQGVVPSGWMEDSDIDPHSGDGTRSDGVTYSLVAGHGGAWSLQMDLDEKWLHSPDRVFPVTVDPTMTAYDPTADTYVMSPYNNDNSTDGELKVGTWNGGSNKSAAYLRFNAMTQTLQNHYILGGSLNLYETWSYSCSARQLNVYRITQSGWSVGAATTWPGPTYDSTHRVASKSFAHAYSGCGAAWESIKLDADRMTKWAHHTESFYGLTLRASSTDSYAYKKFASANAAVSNNRPHLDVNYADQGAAYALPHKYFSPAVTGTQAGKITVRVTNWGTSTWTPTNGYKLGYTVLNSSGTSVKTGSFTIPQSTGPHHSVDVTASIGPLDPGSYSVRFDMKDPSGNSFSSTYGAPYGTVNFSVANTPPTITGNWPENNGYATTLRPTLWAEYFDPDDYPAGTHKLSFKVCTGTEQAPTGCQTSGWVDTASWTPPNPVGTWGTTALWWVQASDGTNQGPLVGPLYFTPSLAQPEITSHLSDAGADAASPGLDAEVGNYSTTVTDASVPVVGPALAITRTYNSQDPRTDSAFGAGWRSGLDQRLVTDTDGSGNVVLTLASGRQLRFGRNPDGTFSPPSGYNLTLVDTPAANGDPEYWTLRDATGTRTRFDASGQLQQVTDADGNTQILAYGADGKLSSITDTASGRALHLTWTSGHVTAVDTDAPDAGSTAPRWTYSYTGDLLTTVCTPLSAQSCTTYSYQSSSHYRSIVADDNPTGYWPLAEQVGEDGQAPDAAGNVVGHDDSADAGEYTQVTVGTPGPLSGSAQTGVAFNGSGSLQLTDDLLTKSASNAVELWFTAAAGQQGVLFGEQNSDLGDTATHYTPDIYVGTDGKLYGWFWSASCSGCQMYTTGRVDDGAWHHVVLTSEVDHQQLYLDGALVGTDDGHIPDHTDTDRVLVGRSYTSTRWTGAIDGDFGFGGSIAQVAVYHHGLTSGQVDAHYAARAATHRLSSITEPGNVTAATLTYDDGSGRVATLTDRNGATWTLGAPHNADDNRSIELSRTDRAPITYTYDLKHNGRLTDRDDGDDSEHWDYNAAGFADTYTDPDGRQFVDYTDDRGNVVEHGVWRNGDWRFVKYGYYLNSADPLDPRNDRVTYITDPRFNTSYILRRSYTLDAAGRATRITYPRQAAGSSNPSETFTYSTGTEPADGGGTVPAGLLLNHTGLRNQSTTNTYNSHGDLTSVTDPAGLLTTISYDALGRPTSTTRADGTTTLPEGGGHPSYGTVETTWTPTGLPDTITGPETTNAITATVHTPQTSYAYNAAGQPTSMTVADTTGNDPGRTTTYGYDAQGRLASTTDPTQQTTSQTWSTAGDIASTTLPGGLATQMRYNDQHQLVEADAVGSNVDPTDPQATSLVLESRGYDPSGDLVLDVDAQGRTTEFTYFGDRSPETATRKDVVAADGTTHDVVLFDRVYDAAGNVVQETDAGNVVHQYAYDTTGDQLRNIVDPGGLSISHALTYDADGNPLSDTLTRSISFVPGTSIETKYLQTDNSSVIDPQQRRVADGTSSFTYAIPLPDGVDDGTVHVDVDNEYLVQAGTTGTDWPFSSTGSASDGSNYTDLTIPISGLGGGRTIYVKVSDSSTADGYGARVTGVTLDASSSTETRSSSYTYNAAGQPLTATIDNPGGDQSSLTTTTSYDPRGLPTSVTDPATRTTTYSYDNADQPITRAAAARTVWVNGTSTDNVTPTTTVGYNTFGDTTQVRDPDGHTATTTVDADGRTLTRTLPDYTTPGGVTLQATDSVSYTADGLPDKITDPLGNVTNYTYDPYGRPVTVTRPDPDTPDGPNGPVTTASYDRDGELTSVTSPTGALSSATYDELGRQVTSTQADRFPGPDTLYYTTKTGYDDASNPISTTTPAGHVTANTFDTAGRLLSSTDPVGHYQNFSYGLDGQITLASNQDTYTTQYYYDRAGRLTSRSDFEGPDTLAPATASTTQSTVIAPHSVQLREWAASYGADSQVARTVSPEGRTSDFTYDPDGNPTAVTQYSASGADPDPASAVTVDLGYDAAGHRTRMRDGNGHVTGYTYNVWGMPESTVEPATAAHPDVADRTWTTTYDEAGRAVHDDLPGGVGRDRTYDGLDRLTAETGTGAEATTAPRYLGYDEDSRLTSVSGPGADIVYSYDDRGQLSSTHSDSGDSSFGYDQDGNLASATTAAGTATYTYDDADRLATAADPLTGATVGYLYNPTGDLSSIGYGQGGSSRAFTYDGYERLSGDTLTGPDGTTTLASTSYGYDQDDNLTAKTTSGPAGAGANTYRYDGLSRLTGWVDPGGTDTAYGYDGASNRTTATTTAGSRASVFDERNELVSAAGGGQPDLAQTYSPRGTLTTADHGAGTFTYTFDAFERLTQAATPTTTVANTYDGLDRLTTRNGATFGYADQTNNPVTLPAADGATTTISHTPAGAPLASHLTGGSGGGSPPTLLLADQHTDLTAALDPATNTLTASATYSPDGLVQAATGELPVGFQSGYSDPDTGQTNAWARWYDPATARFTSRDTWTLNPDPTTNTNRAIYANANPLAGTDPTGHNCNPCGHSGGGGQGQRCRTGSGGCGGEPCISPVSSNSGCGTQSGLGDVSGTTSGWGTVSHGGGRSNAGGSYGGQGSAGGRGWGGRGSPEPAPDPLVTPARPVRTQHQVTRRRARNPPTSTVSRTRPKRIHHEHPQQQRRHAPSDHRLRRRSVRRKLTGPHQPATHPAPWRRLLRHLLQGRCHHPGRLLRLRMERTLQPGQSNTAMRPTRPHHGLRSEPDATHAIRTYSSPAGGSVAPSRAGYAIRGRTHGRHLSSGVRNLEMHGRRYSLWRWRDNLRRHFRLRQQ